ncbi:MAG TPA: hypothetical protein DDW87_05095, partial [Firmicutes bacterium]|nr:hypothetical protein [Bacillota bacterium]
MKCLEYPLYPGDSVNRWLEMGILQKPMNFESMTMTGEINNRWLIEGFAIHENPTKSEFVNERKKEEVLLLQGLDGAVPSDSWEIYFPWQNPWVDHSDFWYVPTYLQTWAVTYLYSEGPITTRF